MKRLLRRLARLVRPRRFDAELAEELAFHREMRQRDLEQQGAAPLEAALHARRALGNLTLATESARRVWTWPWIESVLQDIRFGLRGLRRSRGFTCVVVLTLALGIGGNTAIFSLIDTLMLQPLPVRAPEQLVELLSQVPGDPRMNYFSWRAFEHYRDGNQVFSDLIGVSSVRFQVALEGRDAGTADGEYVTGRFFPALGVQPAIGRLLAPEDDRSGGDGAAVAVVSWGYWQRRFNRDPSLVGSQIVLNGVPATVVGVAPRGFVGLQVGLGVDVWVPAALEALIQQPSRRESGELGLRLMGRLKPGISLEQARAEMRVLDQWRIEELATAFNNPVWRQATIEVAPAGSGFSALRDAFRGQLLLLMALLLLLLLVACTSVATMHLARATARHRDMAVRASLGAGRLRLMRQTLTESLLLSAMGGTLGIAVAYVGAGALAGSWRLDGRLWGPVSLDIPTAPSAHALLFTAAIVLVTGVLFGLAPAWRVRASSPAASLRHAGGGGEMRPRQLLGNGLVVAQVALSVVLLSAAALFIHHLSHLRHVDLGFARTSVLLMTLDPSRSGYGPDQLSRPYQELLERLEAIPGVRSAALSVLTPLEGPAGAQFVNVEGIEERPEDRRYVMMNAVGPRYFETFGTPLVALRSE